MPHDPRWEFDAPRFYDFEEGTPAGSQEGPDSWFDTSATKGLATPLDKQVCIQPERPGKTGAIANEI